MLLSLVIPTVDRPERLAACLSSIARTVDLPHEVVCVTVEDDEATTRLAREHGAVLVVQDARLGYVRATNAGLRAASGHYVSVLNDDCVLLPHSLANAVRFLEVPAHDRIGQAAFFHDSPVRRNVFSQIRVEDRWYAVCHVRGLCYANFGLARRDLYERLGFLDERYRFYGADPDFSLKVWHDAGLSVAPCPGALIRHEEVADERARVDRSRQGADNRLLFAKWNLDGDERANSPQTGAPDAGSIVRQGRP